MMNKNGKTPVSAWQPATGVFHIIKRVKAGA
jgi:hypothetical protein